MDDGAGKGEAWYMKNTIGHEITLTLFGESHGAAIGAVLDGLPSGFRIDRLVEVEAGLDRLASVQNQLNLRLACQ